MLSADRIATGGSVAFDSMKATYNPAPCHIWEKQKVWDQGRGQPFSTLFVPPNGRMACGGVLYGHSCCQKHIYYAVV